MRLEQSEKVDVDSRMSVAGMYACVIREASRSPYLSFPLSVGEGMRRRLQ